MKNETQPNDPVLLDEEVNPEVAVAQPIPRHVNYKTVLVAVVIGIITIGVLWMFVIRQEDNPIKKTLIMEPDIQAEVNEEVKGPQVAQIADQYDRIDRILASLSDQIDRGIEAQQGHSSVVTRELAALAASIQAIDHAIAGLGESNTERDRRIGENASKLETIAQEVRTLQVVKRKPATPHKSLPIETPPFDVDAIDVWDEVTYVAVSQPGYAAFLTVGEQQSDWTVTRIDYLQGTVDFQGPAGQAYSALLPRQAPWK